MHQSLTASSFLLICIFVTLASVGQIFIKKSVSGGSLTRDTLGETLKNILCTFKHPYAIIGFGLYVVSTFVWLLVLSKVKLSVAYPMMSLSYFLVVILSATVLREKVDKKCAIIGLLLISAGVSCIGFGMGR
jgi:drug/metabolite transporter (DMT)-like permease